MAGTGTLSVRAEATGNLEAWREIHLRAEVTGQVTEVSAREGGRVEQGAVVLRVDERPFQLDLVEAQAELIRAQTDYAVRFRDDTARQPPPEARSEADGAQEELRRLESLFEQGLASREELLRARRQAESVEILAGNRRFEVQESIVGLTQAEQRVRRAQLALEKAVIRAPWSGRIADLEVEPGERVAVGDICFVLLDDSRFQANIRVLESDLVRLRVGNLARVRVPSLDDVILDGRIAAINPKIDPETGTGRVVVEIANTRRELIAGLYVVVELETRRLVDRLLVPKAAILERQGRQLVFCVVDRRARWTYVETGATDGERVEILSGLEAGAVVVVDGHLALAHEALVEVRQADGR